MLTGTKYFLHVTPEDKVRKVKVDIFKELGIKNKVRLMWQNEQMEDCVTLRALGITDDITIQMVIEPDTQIKLRIQTLKKGMVSVIMNDSSTLKDLIKKLSTTTLMSTAHTSEFSYEQTHLSDENLPFHFYGITDGSMIVQNNEGAFKLELIDGRDYSFIKYITVRGTDSVHNLNKKVLHYLNDAYDDRLSEDDIVIFHKEKTLDTNIWIYNELDKESWTLAQCGIKPLHTITIIRYHGDYGDRFSPDIKIDDGSKGKKKTERAFGLYHLESVQSMRLKIQHQLHIPYEKQVLSISGMGSPLNLTRKVGKEKSDQVTLKVLD